MCHNHFYLFLDPQHFLYFLFDAKMFYLFFAFWILFMSSYDYANASRAASDKAIYDTLVYPKFQASDLDMTMPPTTTPTSDTIKLIIATVSLNFEFEMKVVLRLQLSMKKQLNYILPH